MKKIFFTVFFCGWFFSIFSQKSENKILENIQKIEKSLIEKDTLVLDQLLHTDLTFGHTNGWIESKKTLFKDLKNSKVIYTFFDKKSDVQFVFSSDNIAITRREINAHGRFEQHEFTINMNVLEIWILNENDWKLLARQSVNFKN